MKVTLIFFFMYYISFIKCTELDSYEINRVEFTPIHDAIIVNDIVDILSEFESSMKSQLNNHMFSNNDSKEDIDDLLSEYQQYLDKAHEQRVRYIRKSKGKNKIPLLRHEKFNKLLLVAQNNYGEYSNYYFEDMKPSTALLNSFMPHNSNMKLVKNTEHLLDNSKGSFNTKNNLFGNLLPNLSPQNPSEPISPSCICRENVIPCKCQCKNCLFTESAFSKNIKNMNPFTNSLYKTSKYAVDNLSNILDNNINLRIKIDIQLPNISMLSNILKYQNQDKTEEHDDMVPKEILSTINVPFPYLNFPIPMEMIGYTQNVLKDKTPPLHKITIHNKKKKFHLGSNNKKHKNKKVFTLHNLKYDEPQIQQIFTMGYNSSGAINKNNSLINNEKKEIMSNINQYEMIPHYTRNNTTVASHHEILNNQSSGKIYLTINITKGNDSISNNVHKTNNSIETTLENENNNISTAKLLRLKREIRNEFSKSITWFNDYNKTTTEVSPVNNQSTSHIVITNLNKESEIDDELLYWPFANKNQSLIPSKNITALILDKETKKAKLNMTIEKIRNNHTTALEKAIFGDVDWNDVDAVVPIFISFVGKYITGVLTFCSQNVCHSMKCGSKICMHRICTPNNRYNNKGHCVGNNDTDSIATMESIMDLPSNVALEIVDILEEKMLGKLFGKGTLCINSKCSAFAAFKKTFKKTKCTFKELNLAGHCQNLKNMKIL